MFTIIMPVYNSIDTLKVSVDSVINQTYEDWELIIVDDGSTDESGKLCDELAEKNEKITVLHKENGGAAAARNMALGYVKKEYIMFVDADDSLEKNALECLKVVIDKSVPELIIYGYSNDERVDDQIYSRFNRVVENDKYNSNEDLKKAFSKLDECYMTYPIWNKVYKTQVVQDNNIRFPEGITIAEDFIFNLQVFKVVNKIEVLNECLYHYIFEANQSITQQFKKNKLDVYKAVYEKANSLLSDWLPEANNNVKNNFLHEINIYVNNMYNNNSELSFITKRKYVKEMVNDLDIRNIIKDVKPDSARHRIVKWLYMTKCVSGFMAVGRISRIGKRY